ncbi:MAG TPA: hypothetical protein ENF78_02165 [Candidatus Bathyarchaeota archaeon]|nr:hypothetical protein [Candidatus Bathyarchaeota archaeon]
MATGVFFHEEFVGKEWPVIGDRYERFPTILAELARSLPGIRLIEPEPVPEELLARVHTPDYLARVKRAWYYEGARLTVGAFVRACEMVWSGELDNAVVFLVAAGHHAHRDYAWGGTYLSLIGPALVRLRELGLKRLVYIDTDAHHADGAREVLMGDRDVLHICFCHQDVVEDDGTKICIDVGWSSTDDAYMAKVREVLPTIRAFRPQMILHFLGHDTHRDDYGSLGLTEGFFIRLVEELKALAGEVCSGKYVVAHGGGANKQVAELIWPKIIRLLAGEP